MTEQDVKLGRTPSCYVATPEVKIENKVSPADFIDFLPWACKNYRGTFEVLVDAVRLGKIFL